MSGKSEPTAIQSDLAVLRVTLPVIEGSLSYTTTISVSMLRRLYEAALVATNVAAAIEELPRYVSCPPDDNMCLSDTGNWLDRDDVIGIVVPLDDPDLP